MMDCLNYVKELKVGGKFKMLIAAHKNDVFVRPNVKLFHLTASGSYIDISAMSSRQLHDMTFHVSVYLLAYDF